MKKVFFLACLCLATFINVSAGHLHDAVFDGDIRKVKSLLNSNEYIDINQQDSSGNTPLHTAVDVAHVDIVLLLLKAGVRTNIKNGLGLNAYDYLLYRKRIYQDTVLNFENTEFWEALAKVQLTLLYYRCISCCFCSLI